MNDQNLPSVSWDAEKIATLKQTVAQGATDAEFSMFRELCNASGLNPFKREVWFIKAGNRAQIMTGINGFLAIANKNPNYDGMEIDVEVSGGKPVKAIAKVYRKDRRFPSVGIALMSEYGKDTGTWKAMPSHMLMKCAKAIALREAFPQEMNGLYTEEEMPPEYAKPRQEAQATPQVIEVVRSKVEAPSGGPYYYRLIGDLGDDTKEECVKRLDAAGASWDASNAAWKSPIELKKLARMRVDLEAEALGEAIGDDTPAWDEKGAA